MSATALHQTAFPKVTGHRNTCSEERERCLRDGPAVFSSAQALLVGGGARKGQAGCSGAVKHEHAVAPTGAWARLLARAHSCCRQLYQWWCAPSVQWPASFIKK